MSDLISRQAALDAISRIGLCKCSTNEVQAVDECLRAVENLPSVSTEKTGHWRHYEGMLICSECDSEFYDDIMEYCGDDVPKCCPNCGAKMEVVKE